MPHARKEGKEAAKRKEKPNSERKEKVVEMETESKRIRSKKLADVLSMDLTPSSNQQDREQAALERQSFVYLMKKQSPILSFVSKGKSTEKIQLSAENQ